MFVTNTVNEEDVSVTTRYVALRSCQQTYQVFSTINESKAERKKGQDYRGFQGRISVAFRPPAPLPGGYDSGAYS